MLSHTRSWLLLLFSVSLAVANPISFEQLNDSPPESFPTPASLAARQPPAPSAYPYGSPLENEFQWLNWDPARPDHKADAERIHAAFSEWREFAKQATVAAADRSSATFKRWFKNDDAPEDVVKVFQNMWDIQNDKPTDKVARLIRRQDDWKNRCGPNTNAYSDDESGEFHFCQFGLQKPLNSEISCANLLNSCSAQMKSMPMTLLHEMTHMQTIGEAARGILIVDHESGAYKCFQLGDDCGYNAQNYAWLAGEVYWSNMCKKTFRDPEAGVIATGEDEAPPNSNGIGSAQCVGGGLQFHQEEANGVIDKFCNDKDWQNRVIIPPVSFGHKWNDGRTRAIEITQGYDINGGADQLWLSLSFSETDCIGNFQFDKQQCGIELRRILNDCDTAGLFPKYGGSIGQGCAVYRMRAASKNQSSPLYLLSNFGDELGPLVCKDTDVSAIGGASNPLANTCTCSYTRTPTVFDTYPKPGKGCSAVQW